jgi:nephrocystin-3
MTPEELGQVLEGDFTRYLDAKFPEKERPSPLEQERLDHAAFARSRLKVYIGGKEYHKTLDRYVEGTGPPLVVTGEPGSGKSALLATWIARYQQKNPDAYILYHFIGGAPDSADHYSLMRRIMFELKEHFGIEDDIPKKQEKLAELLPLFLAKTTKEPWVLILDALNQLEEKDNARWLGWLPSFFPENIRVILSTLSGEALDTLKKRGYTQMAVTPLTLAERKDLIKEYLKFYTKELNEDRTIQIASDQKAGNPLILRTILDELCIVGLHEKLQDQINYYLKPTTPIAFFTAVLERLERDYDEKHKGMTGKVLSLLWASRRGLSERELLDITGITPLSWAPLYYALESQLVQREGLLDFFHDFLKQAVEERYLKTDETKKKAHMILANYFHKDKPSERVLDELPYHLMKAKEWEKLKDYIGDLDVFIKLNTYKKKYELFGYWNVIGDRYDIVKVYREGLNLLEEKGGTGEKLSYALNQVAVFLQETARYEGAEQLYLRYMGISEKVLGPEHPNTAVSLNNLAALLKSKGDYAGAEPLYRRALGIRERVLGPEHPDTAQSLNNLALVLKSKGDYEGAEPLYRCALEISEKVLGPEHPYTAHSLNNLAVLLY